MFFENTTDLYSYGYHYLAAKVHTVKGQKFALIRSDAYSTSTGGHLGDAERAVRGLMPFFRVAGCDALREPRVAVECLDKNVDIEIDRALARKFFAESHWGGGDDKHHHIAAIKNALETTNQLREILGRKPLKMPKRFEEAEKHLDKLLAKYNSPKRVEKRLAKERHRNDVLTKLQQARVRQSAQALEKFRAGNPNFGWIDSEFDLLRIKGNRIETSGGAEVPLRQARALMNLIEKEGPFALAGKQIGHFTVDNVAAYDTESGSDTLLEIGCHKILLSEVRNVLATAPHLKLVTA